MGSQCNKWVHSSRFSRWQRDYASGENNPGYFTVHKMVYNGWPIYWLSVSPDLACTEHVWDILGRAAYKRIDPNWQTDILSSNLTTKIILKHSMRRPLTEFLDAHHSVYTRSLLTSCFCHFFTSDPCVLGHYFYSETNQWIIFSVFTCFYFHYCLLFSYTIYIIIVSICIMFLFYIEVSYYCRV